MDHDAPYLKPWPIWAAGVSRSRKSLDRQAQDAVEQQAILAAVKKRQTGFRIVVAEGPQATEILRADPGAVFHFDRLEQVLAVGYEIDLDAAAGCQ